MYFFLSQEEPKVAAWGAHCGNDTTYILAAQTEAEVAVYGGFWMQYEGMRVCVGVWVGGSLPPSLATPPLPPPITSATRRTSIQGTKAVDLKNDRGGDYIAENDNESCGRWFGECLIVFDALLSSPSEPSHSPYIPHSPLTLSAALSRPFLFSSPHLHPFPFFTVSHLPHLTTLSSTPFLNPILIPRF